MTEENVMSTETDETQVETPTTTEQPTEEIQAEPTAEELQAAEEAQKQQEQKEWEEQRSVEQKPWFQKKIDKLTALRRQAERLADAERQRADQVQAMLDKAIDAKGARREPEQQVQASPKPNINDFESDEEYYDALSDWKMELYKAKQAAEMRQKEQEAQEQQFYRWFDENRQRTLMDGRQAYRDFEDVIYTIPKDILTVDVTADIFETGNPSGVMYHLGNNPAEAERIARLHPTRRAVELGKIEANLDKPKQKPITKAPPIIRPISGTKQPSAVPDPGKDPSAWIRMRNEGKI